MIWRFTLPPPDFTVKICLGEKNEGVATIIVCLMPNLWCVSWAMRFDGASDARPCEGRLSGFGRDTQVDQSCSLYLSHGRYMAVTDRYMTVTRCYVNFTFYSKFYM